MIPTIERSESWTEEALDAFVDSLDARIQQLLGEIKPTRVWRVLTDPDTDPALVRLIMREVYLEIYSYQPHVITATIAIISRMPKADARMISKLLIHQAEEADHGEMALMLVHELLLAFLLIRHLVPHHFVKNPRESRPRIRVRVSGF